MGKQTIEIIYENLKDIILNEYSELFVMNELSNGLIYMYCDQLKVIYIKSITIFVEYNRNMSAIVYKTFVWENDIDIINLIKKSYKHFRKYENNNNIGITFNLTEIDKLLNLIKFFYNLNKKRNTLF
jgi:hypothetical protein